MASKFIKLVHNINTEISKVKNFNGKYHSINYLVIGKTCNCSSTFAEFIGSTTSMRKEKFSDSIDSIIKEMKENNATTREIVMILGKEFYDKIISKEDKSKEVEEPKIQSIKIDEVEEVKEEAVECSKPSSRLTLEDVMDNDSDKFIDESKMHLVFEIINKLINREISYTDIKEELA